jgi:hypothetical protein
MIKVTVPKERTLKDKEDIRAILKYTKVNMENLKRRAQKENTLILLKELIDSK